MQFWAHVFLTGQALPKVGASRRRNDTFFQKITFLGDATLHFNIGAAGVGQAGHGHATGRLQAWAPGGSR